MGLRSCSRSSCFIDDWLEIVRPKRSRAERGLRCTLTSAITSNNMASKAMSFHSNARGRGNGQWQYQDHWAQPKDYLSVGSFRLIFDMPRRQSRWPCQRQCDIDSGNGWNDPKEGMTICIRRSEERAFLFAFSDTEYQVDHLQLPSSSNLNQSRLVCSAPSLYTLPKVLFDHLRLPVPVF